MRVVFMGTPDFAVDTLKELILSGHSVVGVFTRSDKKKGRGNILTPSPVKEEAIRHNLEVFEEENLKEESVYNKIKDLAPDVIVVVAYGKILPKQILDLPKFGCINVHGSLLPKYRGAAPIQWAIINGEEETGITIMFMDQGLDTGDILLQEKIKILKEDTSKSLYKKLSVLGAKTLVKTLEELLKMTITPKKQQKDQATYSKMLSKEDALIDWSQKSSDINNLIRGLNPWPVAYTRLDGKVLKVYKAKEFFESERSIFPSRVISLNPFVVSCGENTALEILELQFENKKRMDSASFLRGYRIKNKDLFTIG